MVNQEKLEQHYSSSGCDAIYCGLHEGKPLLYKDFKNGGAIGFPMFLLCDPKDPFNRDKVQIITDTSLELFKKSRDVLDKRSKK